MITLQIYRAGSPHITVPIDESTYFSQKVMGEHIIVAKFISDHAIDIQEGDYIQYGGEVFTLNRPQPPLVKSSNSNYEYTLTFEGYVYDLIDQDFFASDGALEFSDYKTPAGFVQLIVDCMNDISSGWAVGTTEDISEKSISFYSQEGKGYNCKSALVKMSDELGLEFWLRGKTIHLTKQSGVQTALKFKYGRGNGLYQITRGQADDQPYFNRLRVQGSTKNIPFGYRDGAARLRMDVPYIELPLPAGKKRRSASVIIDEVFPSRVGEIATVSADYLTLTDPTIDFDLNGNKIEGSTPTISFTTGENAGRDFEIRSYNHSTHTLVINPIVEKDGYTFPSAVFTIAPGDKYVILGIEMPESYVIDAEARLKAAGQVILNRGYRYIPPYSIKVQDKFMRDNGITVSAGDRVGLVDVPMEVDASIRVSGVRFPLVNKDMVDLTISDVIPLSVEEKAIVEADKAKDAIIDNKNLRLEDARKSAVNLNKLTGRVFDPDGNLAKGDATLYAAMGKFGFDSQNFDLVGVKISTNIANDENTFAISGGQLLHRIYDIDGLGYTWEMSPNSWTGLDPLKHYYVYAKCSKIALIGTWEISETEVGTNDILGYWAFNLGQLYEVSENWREFYFTKGTTYIVGNQIKTGEIDAEIVNVINLNANNITTGSIDAGVIGVTNLNADNITSGSIDASVIDVNNLDADNITSGTIATDRLDAATITSDIIQVADLSADQLTAGSINASIIGVYNLDADNITSGTIATGRLDAATVKSTIVQTTDLNADKIVAGTLDAGTVAVINLDADNITSGTIATARLDAATITSDIVQTADLNADQITAGTIDASVIDVTNINADNITAGTVDAARVDTDNLFVGNVSDGWIINKDVIQSKALVGGVPKTELKTDGSLAAIDATITGTTRTAATGKRAELSGPNNNFRLYDASGNIIFDLDDDSAIESITGGIPVYGPGIRVGQLSGNNASISPKGLYVKDNTTGDFAYIRPSGIYTDGDLQANGQTNVEGLGVGGNLSISSSSNVLVGAEVGLTFESDVRMGGGDFWRMTWVKGILVNAVNLGP